MKLNLIALYPSQEGKMGSLLRFISNHSRMTSPGGLLCKYL